MLAEGATLWRPPGGGLGPTEDVWVTRAVAYHTGQARTVNSSHSGCSSWAKLAANLIHS